MLVTVVKMGPCIPATRYATTVVVPYYVTILITIHKHCATVTEGQHYEQNNALLMAGVLPCTRDRTRRRTPCLTCHLFPATLLPALPAHCPTAPHTSTCQNALFLRTRYFPPATSTADDDGRSVPACRTTPYTIHYYRHCLLLRNVSVTSCALVRYHDFVWLVDGIDGGTE